MSFPSQLVLVVLLLCTGGGSTPLAEQSTICGTPAAIEAALKDLRNQDWKELNVARVEHSWPVKLIREDCDGPTCRTLRTQIPGAQERQCVAIFTFVPDARSEQLSALLIRDSSRDSRRVVALARRYSKALGVSDREAHTINESSTRHFQWIGQNEQKVSGAEVRVERQHRTWTLYLYFAQQ